MPKCSKAAASVKGTLRPGQCSQPSQANNVLPRPMIVIVWPPVRFTLVLESHCVRLFG